jgi:hypothetical protein
MNPRFAKVKASSGFGDVIIPWNNCRSDAGRRDLDGSTERWVLTGLSKDNGFLFHLTFWSPSNSHRTSMAILKSLPFEFSDDNSEIFNEL